MKKFEYAGKIIYQPHTTLGDHIRQQLREILINRGLIQRAENPAVVIDWLFSESDSNRTVLMQSAVVLYRDGGDAESPAFIFYRIDKDFRTRQSVEKFHIPPEKVQSLFREAWGWWDDPSKGKLNILNVYLDEIMNNSNAWTPL